MNQKIKADEGKPKLSLVPWQIVYDIARVREYGNQKYGGTRKAAFRTCGMWQRTLRFCVS